MLALTPGAPVPATGRPGPLPVSPDYYLARRVQAGEQAAFTELVERYRPRVLGVVFGILRNRQDAEEIAQDVFTKVYLSIAQFASRGSLAAWIHRIAVNECFAHLRKRCVRLVFEADSVLDLPGVGLQSVADSRPTVDRTLADRDFINHLFARMPKSDRRLLLCRAVDGLSVLEVAEITGLTESAVKVRLFRARRRLAGLATNLSHPPRRGRGSHA